MANPTGLAEWLIRNSDSLDLRVTTYAWPGKWGMHDIFDMQVSLKLSGRIFSGRGTARGEELAFVKAGAEALERAYCIHYGLHSTGIAAHTEEPLAAANARSELFERQAFYCHFYTKTPFLPVADIQLPYPETLQKIADHGISIRPFRAFTTGRPVVLVIASGIEADRPWGGIVGLASDEREESAWNSALLECIRNVAAVIHIGVGRTMTPDEFQKIEVPSAADRQALALNREFWRSVQYLFPPEDEDIDLGLRNAVAWTPQVVSKLENPFPEIKEAPIVVCRAQARDQDSIFSRRDRSPVTKTGLEEFMGLSFDVRNLNKTPSFLG